MDATVARRIATLAHEDQTDRSGQPVLAHLARVAASVPVEAQATAWLHDILERTSTSVEWLKGQGLTALEAAALRLLTRPADEAYEAYALDIAFARGSEGRLARLVKLADLDDHLRSSAAVDHAPPYAWARRHISNAQFAGRVSATAL